MSQAGASESFPGFVTWERGEMSDFILLGLLNRVEVNLELPSAIFLGSSEGVFIIIEQKVALLRKVGPRDEGRGKEERKGQINIGCLWTPDLVMLKINASLGFSSYESITIFPFCVLTYSLEFVVLPLKPTESCLTLSVE